VSTRRPATQIEYLAILRNKIVPAIGAIPVSAVSFSDIARLHRKLSAPVRANRAVAIASKMFSLAIRWEMCTDNPCRGIERNPEEPRTRHLSAAELSAFVGALDAYPDQMLRIFTGFSY
jgi:hypothetical protein